MRDEVGIGCTGSGNGLRDGLVRAGHNDWLVNSDSSHVLTHAMARGTEIKAGAHYAWRGLRNLG